MEKYWHFCHSLKHCMNKKNILNDFQIQVYHIFSVYDKDKIIIGHNNTGIIIVFFHSYFYHFKYDFHALKVHSYNFLKGKLDHIRQ